MSQSLKKGFSNWLHGRLVQVPANKTVAVLVDKTEIEELEFLKPHSDSEHFRLDLSLHKYQWIYHENRRVLVVQHQTKVDHRDAVTELRNLGALTCQQLQAKKSAEAEILVSSKIKPDNMGVFWNSVYLTNYEWTLKSNLQEESKKEVEDERTLRTSKLLDSFQIFHEQDLDQYKLYKRHQAFARATVFARNLSNTRANPCDPGYMEEQVRKLIENHNVKLTVVKGQQLLDQGMNLFHAVGRAAVSEPRCIVVHYEGNPDSQDCIAFVGKGLTYDTGGLNIKPTGGMEEMYGDKNGACAVIGALHGVLDSKPKINLVFAVGAAENAIGSRAYKPSDIIKSKKGLTVNIGNTDAEGRLVLADTITYVQQEFKPTELIDLATLTGACMIALGLETAGLFSNDDDLAGKLLKSGKNVYEPLWRMPIMPEHHEAIKHPNADLDNIPKCRPYGGACCAAAFLERFIEKGTKWAHLDIAGPALKNSAKAPMIAMGNGFGTQILLDYIWSKCE